MKKSRRLFIKEGSQYAAAFGLIALSPGLTGCGGSQAKEKEEADTTATTAVEGAAEMFFSISLAQWSLNKAFFGGELDNLDFAAIAKNTYGIDAIEYVNQFFKDKAKDNAYLAEMKKRAADNGVKSLLIMVDGEGSLGDLDDKKRAAAVNNHHKWVDAAKFLGCHSIRVNAAGKGTAEDVGKAATDGLGRLSEYAATAGLNVIVENHGGYSSNGQWLSNVIKNVGLANCGTLPDFGNFCIKRGEDGCEEEYDRYQGVTELMPYAKAVSAKSHEFDIDGNEVDSDYMKIMKIVKDAGYTGYVGIEYEGSQLTPEQGIKATKRLLEKVGKALS